MNIPLIQQDLAALATRGNLKRPANPPKRKAAPSRPQQRLHPAIAKAAQQAITHYRASADYADVKATLAGMTLAQLMSRLRLAVEGPLFAPLFDRIRQVSQLDTAETDSPEDPLEDFIPKAVSLGLMGQAVLFVGLSGSAGYAIDVDLTNPDSCVYVGGAVDAGIDAGIEIDVCLGLWRESVSDLGGTYFGGEVDADEGGGVVIAMFEDKDNDVALVFAGIDLGIDDGVEGLDFYFFKFDTGSAPIYQPGDANYMVQFQGLTCLNSKNDYDGIYFEFMADSDSTVYRFPAWDSYQMCESHRNENLYKWSAGLIVKFNTSFKARMHIGDVKTDYVSISNANFQSVGSTFTIDFKFDDPDNKHNQIEYTLVLALLKG